MSEKLNRLISKLTGKKGMTFLFAAGIAGILLISISGMSGKGKSGDAEKKNTINNEQYCKSTEKKIKSIVTALTGDAKPSVVVTLDTGVKYVYADETKQDSADNTDTKSDYTKTQKSDKTENNCVIVEDANGTQTALKITECMPTVRGVTVVCRGGNDPTVAERVRDAVITALDVTSKRVYVTGK